MRQLQAPQDRTARRNAVEAAAFAAVADLPRARDFQVRYLSQAAVVTAEWFAVHHQATAESKADQHDHQIDASSGSGMAAFS